RHQGMAGPRRAGIERPLRPVHQRRQAQRQDPEGPRAVLAVAGGNAEAAGGNRQAGAQGLRREEDSSEKGRREESRGEEGAGGKGGEEGGREKARDQEGRNEESGREESRAPVLRRYRTRQAAADCSQGGAGQEARGEEA